MKPTRKFEFGVKVTRQILKLANISSSNFLNQNAYLKQYNKLKFKKKT